MSFIIVFSLFLIHRYSFYHPHLIVCAAELPVLSCYVYITAVFPVMCQPGVQSWTVTGRMVSGDRPWRTLSPGRESSTQPMCGRLCHVERRPLPCRGLWRLRAACHINPTSCPASASLMALAFSPDFSDVNGLLRQLTLPSPSAVTRAETLWLSQS